MTKPDRWDDEASNKERIMNEIPKACLICHFKRLWLYGRKPCCAAGVVSLASAK